MADDARKPYPYESYDEAYYERIAAEARRNGLSYRWRMHWLDVLLDVRPGDRVVDMGSGAGVVSQHMAERGAAVEAVDLAEAAVAAARRRCAHLPIHFTVADAADCPHLASAAFDKIACCDLVEHVHDETMFGVLREAWRLLKPGGLFFLYTPNRRHWIERLKAHNIIIRNPVGHIRVRRPAEVVAALEQSGFEIARVARPVSWLPVVRCLEWLWIHQPLWPGLCVYRICVLARKPDAAKEARGD